MKDVAARDLSYQPDVHGEKWTEKYRKFKKTNGENRGASETFMSPKPDATEDHSG